MSATQELKDLIIKARFGEHHDAKMYLPVATDILFLLNKTNNYTKIAMSNDGFINYGYAFLVGFAPQYYNYIIQFKTLNEDGVQTNIKDWGDEKCKEILNLINS